MMKPRYLRTLSCNLFALLGFTACGDDLFCESLTNVGCTSLPDLDSGSGEGETDGGEETGQELSCQWADVLTFQACHEYQFPHVQSYPADCYKAATVQRDTCPDLVQTDGRCQTMDSPWGMWTWCESEQWVCKVDALDSDKGPVCVDTCGQTWLLDSEPKPTACP